MVDPRQIGGRLLAETLIQSVILIAHLGEQIATR
jgi:hypothetical protein